MSISPRQIEQLLERTQKGDVAAGVVLLMSHRQRLRELIHRRLQRNLRRHVDPSDLVQETLVHAGKRLSQYVEDRPVPFFVWLRRLALDQIARSTRHYLQTQKRSPQVGVYEELADDSAQAFVSGLADSLPTPPSQVISQEQTRRVLDAVRSLPKTDRDLIEYRFLEGLSAGETASMLNLKPGNVRTRTLRALKMLRKALEERENIR